MLVVTLCQVVLTAMIAPRQDFVNGVEGLSLSAVVHRPRVELNNRVLRKVNRLGGAEDAIFKDSTNRIRRDKPPSVGECYTMKVSPTM